MGLDIHLINDNEISRDDDYIYDDNNVHMCYSSYRRVSNTLIRAMIDYIAETEPQNLSIFHEVAKWKSWSEYFELSDKIYTRQYMVGLFKFVTHSDCCGFLSHGDILDISTTLEIAMKYVPDEPHIESLFDLFTASIQQHRIIEYS